MNKRRLRIVMTLVILTGISYVINQTIFYKYINDIRQKKAEIKALEEENRIAQIQIDTKISREQILEEHPDLTMNDNIYYLQKDEDEQEE